MTKEDVEEFLTNLKIAIDNHGLDVVPRDANNEALIDFNLTPSIREQIVLHLAYHNYSDGPLFDDRQQSGNVWIFGIEVDDQEIYIKLKVVELGKQKYAKCLSFHRAQYPIKYPFKQQ